LLTTRTAGALVAGSAGGRETEEGIDVIRRNQPANLRVRVDRPFYYLGRVQTAGSEFELPRGFASEMIAVHKATLIDGAAPVPAPATVAGAAPVSTPDKHKGGKDAG